MERTCLAIRHRLAYTQLSVEQDSSMYICKYSNLAVTKTRG